MTALSLLANAVIPVFIGITLVLAIRNKVPLFDAFTAGAAGGMESCVKLLPTLVALMTAVAMLQASGIFEWVTGLLSPVTGAVGLPGEAVPLALMRPFSGSGSLSLFENLLREKGADSAAGVVGAILMSSTETTFYAVTVYFGSVGITRTRHTLVSALAGDAAGVVMAVVTAHVFNGIAG